MYDEQLAQHMTAASFCYAQARDAYTAAANKIGEALDYLNRAQTERHSGAQHIHRGFGLAQTGSKTALGSLHRRQQDVAERALAALRPVMDELRKSAVADANTAAGLASHVAQQAQRM